MNSYSDKSQNDKRTSVANEIFEKKDTKRLSPKFIDNRPKKFVQRQIRTLVNTHNPNTIQQKQKSSIPILQRAVKPFLGQDHTYYSSTFERAVKGEEELPLYEIREEAEAVDAKYKAIWERMQVEELEDDGDPGPSTVADSKEEEEEDEAAVIAKLNLDTTVIYRALDLSEDADVSELPLFGFFSTSLAYSKQFYSGGSKGNSNSIIKTTLSESIGSILIKLIRGKAAFKQNAGDLGKHLSVVSKTKADQKSVKNKMIKDGFLDKKGNLDKKYKRMAFGGENRKNVPNALMIKQEPESVTEKPVTNLEITSRITDKSKVLIDHPFDQYAVSIEKMTREELE